jgi:PAS domain S-box-containing protein
LAARDTQDDDRFAELNRFARRLSVGIAFLDPELRVVNCNEHFASLCGGQLESCRGRPVGDVLPGLADRLVPMCHEVYREGTPVHRMPIDAEPSGSQESRQTWLASCYRRVDSGGDVSGVTVMLHGTAAPQHIMPIVERRASAEVERHLLANQNQQLLSDLQKRVKELTFLQDLSRILQHDEVGSVTDLLKQVAGVIQELWPLPGAIAVRASLGAFVTTLGRSDGLLWLHRSEFSVADRRVGALEIAGRAHQNRPLNEAGLLDMVARVLRTAIDRRLATDALRQSEERYRSVVEHQSDLVCRFLPDTTLTFVNEAYCQFFRKTRDQLIGSRFVELIPESARDPALKHIASVADNKEQRVHEHPVLMPDGSLGRQQWINHPIVSAAGTVEELQGIGRDITARWRAEEAVRQNEVRLRDAYQRIRWLAQRLILAQEAERTEIARDLHDDIGQQLAALTIGLSLIESRASDRPELRDECAALRQIAWGLADKVRSASHALHPGVLKHAGLCAALASHCEAITAQHGVSVTFQPDGSVDEVADEVALCLYRVVQQALRNVVMHADASHASVRLWRRSGSIELVIDDDGCGFDPSKAHARGIGLMSIEERVGLASGMFSIHSTPGGGSTLRIEIPDAASAYLRAASDSQLP